MKRLAVASMVLLLATSAASAGGLNKDQVAGDAKWVAHLDVTKAAGSQLGQFVLQKLAAKDEFNTHIKEFVDKVGFDPTKDIKSITIYGKETGPAAEKDAVVVVQAELNREKLLALLAVNPDHKEVKYGDLTIQQWSDKNKKTGKQEIKFGFFWGQDVAVIAGSIESTQAAADVLTKKKAALAADALVAPAADAILVVAAAGFAVPDKTPPVLKTLQRIKLEAGETDGKVFVRASGAVANAESADTIRKLLEGFIAMAGLVQPNGDPEKTVQAQAATMLRAVKVTVDGTTLKVEGAWAVEQVTDLVTKAEAAKQQKREQSVPKQP